MVDQADYNWLSNIKNNYYYVGNECIPKCKEAMQNNDMQMLSNTGYKMYEACDSALHIMANTGVSSNMQNLKQKCAEYFDCCGKAGYSFNHGDVNGGINWMNTASNTLSPADRNDLDNALGQVEAQTPQPQ